MKKEHCGECVLDHHAYCTGCVCDDELHNAVVQPGWYHTTRSTPAHCFGPNGMPLCQESDVGDRIPRGRYEQVIGKLCESCRIVLVSRIRMGILRGSRRAW